jgi:hypothetical protein
MRPPSLISGSEHITGGLCRCALWSSAESVIAGKKDLSNHHSTGAFSVYWQRDEELWCLFGKAEKNLNLSEGVGPLEHILVIPRHPAIGL